MSRKRFKAEEIVNKLREADVLIAQGRTVTQASKQIVVPMTWPDEKLSQRIAGAMLRKTPVTRPALGGWHGSPWSRVSTMSPS